MDLHVLKLQYDHFKTEFELTRSLVSVKNISRIQSEQKETVFISLSLSLFFCVLYIIYMCVCVRVCVCEMHNDMYIYI